MSELLGIATLFGVAVGVVGVVAAVLQLRALGRQRTREFEDLFVQRYWKIMDDLSLEALESVKPDGGVVSSSDRKVVISFLMLSEDELDLRAERWITAGTWELWRDGMATRLCRWPFEEVWDEVRNRENDVADGQFSQLRKASSWLYEAGFDPERSSRPRRPRLHLRLQVR